MNNFFGMLSRMKYINRWGLMRNNLNENIVVLSGQLYAKGLYESVGFNVISDVYDEVNIPHVKMKVEL